MTFIKIKNATIHYEYIDNQCDTTFLFVNSLGTDFRIWDGVVAELKKYGNIIRFDKQGHGLSSLADETVSIGDYAADVVGLLDALNIKKVVYVGLSIGGIIGQYLAVHHADRLEKLILSNTAPKIGNTEGWNARIHAVKTNGITSITEGVMKVWFSENFHQNHQNELTGYKNMLSNTYVEGYARACAAIRDNDLTDDITQISVPTLCFAGSQDGSTPPDLVKAMAEKIPNSAYILVDGVGHIPCVEAPSIISKYIIDFVFDKPTSLYEQGMKTRRTVLGNAHVDKAEANKTDFDKDFQEYITNSAWGAVWSRPHLTKRERSMITIAVLAALGHDEEVAMHIRATKNTGATMEDIKEVLLHIGVYAGVPVSNNAYKIAKKVYSEGF
ncbi:MAG: 3-oxoadipate enol-lactonase [Saprospiraceae bacterium]|nr:3-oxoadipate enol-lactonase [Saprospiraceae bacterium]